MTKPFIHQAGKFQNKNCINFAGKTFVAMIGGKNSERPHEKLLKELTIRGQEPETGHRPQKWRRMRHP